MRLLVLGGTLFLGRHLVQTALARGHHVTTFTRGCTNPDLFPAAESLQSPWLRALHRESRRADALVVRPNWLGTVYRREG